MLAKTSSACEIYADTFVLEGGRRVTVHGRKQKRVGGRNNTNISSGWNKYVNEYVLSISCRYLALFRTSRTCTMFAEHCLSQLFFFVGVIHA